MASKIVADAFLAKLSGWTNTPVIGPEDAADNARGNAARLTVEFDSATTVQTTMAAFGDVADWEETGTAVLSLMVPPNSGSYSNFYTWKDQLVALFRAAFFDGVESLGATSTDDMGPGFSRAVIEIPYRRLYVA